MGESNSCSFSPDSFRASILHYNENLGMNRKVLIKGISNCLLTNKEETLW